MTELQEVLKFIEKIESENSGKSAYEITNLLRGYTKPQYTTKLWSLATGYNQKYIQGEFQGKLNHEVVLSGEKTDFGHFIAALSDQINQPGIRKSDLTCWTSDHTSWAGDIGSAIMFYRSQSQAKKISLDEALKRLASDSDYTANIAAYLIGAKLNSDYTVTLSQAIAQYNAIEYTEHIQTFIKKRFGGIILGNKLQNPNTLEAEIRRVVSTYIQLSDTASDFYTSVKNLLRLQLKLEWGNNTAPHSSDLSTGSLHFLSHLIKYGNLAISH